MKREKLVFQALIQNILTLYCGHGRGHADRRTQFRSFPSGGDRVPERAAQRDSPLSRLCFI